MGGATSNIRWDMDSWQKITPRHWRITARDPARFFQDVVDIRVTDYKEWQVFVNRHYIASFDSWDEAALTAPMLYQLHKDTK